MFQQAKRIRLNEKNSADWSIYAIIRTKFISSRIYFYIKINIFVIMEISWFSIYIYIYIYKYHHDVVPLAGMSRTLSRHFSLSFIASGRSNELHPVSSHRCCIYVRAGRPAFAWPYAGVHWSTSLMSSSLLLQQCPTCLVRLTWIVFLMGSRWSCEFVKMIKDKRKSGKTKHLQRVYYIEY